MNDDLNDLKAMMDDATPRPDAARRAENLALAQKNFENLQGSRQQPRPTPTTEAKGLWTGVKTMLNTFTSKAALSTTTALVACGFLFLTPQGQDLLSPSAEAGLTRTEFDGNVAEPRIENGPLVQDDVTSDMLLQEPATAPLGDVIQSPPRVLEEQVQTEIAPPVVNEPLINPSSRSPKPSDFYAQSTGATPEAAPEQQVIPSLSANGLDVTTVEDYEAGAPAAELVQEEPSFSGSRSVADAASSPLEDTKTAPVLRADVDVGPVRGAVSYLQDNENVVLTQPNTETFPTEAPNDLKITGEEPVSTFSIDVDTAAYSVVRSSLSRGQLPPAQAVRIEEMINYFPYDYPAPDAGEAPFRPTVSAFPTPWNADTQLVHIALQGEMPALDDRPPLNLVFLIDTSGSMNDPAKLPLLKQSFRLMLNQLRPEDEVAIVEYAGSAGQVLAPTPASGRTTILQAIQGLGAGGSTNGQGGLQQAYAVADTMKEDGQINRVILATDGDFNVGLSNPDALKDFIADKRDTGTYLSVLGFGRGNLDDATMQALAQNGNGTAAYIDTLSEAQKVLVDQLTGALFTIAGDVKVQVEFNPARIAEYRLIGYETRALNREDFNNDKVDAGELGAGHAVTAIYEVTPVGSPAQLSDPLRYAPNTVAAASEELGFVKLRYKEPGASVSQLIETPIIGSDIPGTEANFAAAIAGFGQLLRDDRYLGDWGYDAAIALANANRGEDAFGYRTEAVRLMRLAQSLSR
jgi:Ca-activated chloride channel family protein